VFVAALDESRLLSPPPKSGTPDKIGKIAPPPARPIAIKIREPDPGREPR